LLHSLVDSFTKVLLRVLEKLTTKLQPSPSGNVRLAQ